MSIDTRAVHQALRYRYLGNGATTRNGEWVYADEVRIAPGFSHYGISEPGRHPDLIHAREQSIDAVAINCWPSKRFRRLAFEVKTSTSDLRRELQKPDKCRAALAISNEFWLVATDDVKVLDREIPDEWGILRFDGTRFRTQRPAPWRENDWPPFSFMLSMLRNVQKPTI